VIKSVRYLNKINCFCQFILLETAENVGLSCRLLTNEMIIKRIEEDTEAGVMNALDIFRNELIEKIEELFKIHIDNKDKRLNWENLGIDLEHFEGFSLLITGSALVHALSNQLKSKFLELSTMCKTVICCRVTPLQKAQVVELIMQNEKMITLAIGDGANDVSMIQSEGKIQIDQRIILYLFE
jgi:phospholipid-translocating ATPase